MKIKKAQIALVMVIMLSIAIIAFLAPRPPVEAAGLQECGSILVLEEITFYHAKSILALDECGNFLNIHLAWDKNHFRRPVVHKIGYLGEE